MMRLHREQERERESAGLERYAAEVARNPPTMSAESRAMSMAAAAAASRTPGCRHMAEKVMIKCMAAKVPAAAPPPPRPTLRPPPLVRSASRSHDGRVTVQRVSVPSLWAWTSVAARTPRAGSMRRAERRPPRRLRDQGIVRAILSLWAPGDQGIVRAILL